MLHYFNQKRGQSTLEYIVLIVVIIGALLTIQVYIKRGIQGRLKSSADDIGDQYSDGNTNDVKTTVRNSQTEETFNQGQTISQISQGTIEVTNTTENSVIDNTSSEFWGGSTTAGGG
jgi:cytoskeletal protein RodZ